MATKFISFKILVILFSNFIYAPAAEMIQTIPELSQNSPNKGVFYVFAIALFLPEMGVIVSSKFREWIKDGLENNDGVLDGSDLKEMIGYLGAYYCAKLFALLMLCDIFYEVDIKDTYVYLCFSGFAGTTGALQISKIFKK